MSDLFDVSRGKRILRDIDYYTDKTLNNIYPVITSTTINVNSIDGYYNNYNCDWNVIVCGGEASGMYSTYHNEKCWVMNRARILKPKKHE